MRVIKMPLWWCRNCNIPLREPSCSLCGGAGTEISLTEPGDIRPAFRGDLKYIEEAVLSEFGDFNISKLLGIEEGSTYLNKVPFIDDMKEVIVGGAIVGRLYFDIATMKWRWRLSGVSSQLLVDYGKTEFVVRDKVRPLEVIKDGGFDGAQLPIVNTRGRVIALAVSRGGVFRVQKLFKGDVRYPITTPKASLKDVLRGNEYRIRRLTSLASAKVYSISTKVTKPLIASYSGGKDSLVSLHICLQLGLEPRMLFLDTGLELPETVKNVDIVAKTFGLNLDYLGVKDAFWRALDTYGPPARDYRWCCKVIKLAPIARYYKEGYRDGALVVVGQRAYESLSRSRSGHLWRNKWLPSVLNISPVQMWDQLTEWIYIMEHRLPYNSLYDEGFDRLGCYLCPAANIAEYCLIEKLYPELYKAWTQRLTAWQRTLNQPHEWVKYHLWRWLGRNSPGRQRVVSYLRIANVSEGTPANTYTPLRGSRLGLVLRPSGNHVRVESSHYRLIEPVLFQRSVIGLIDAESIDNNNIVLKPGSKDSTTVILQAREVIVQGAGATELAYDVVKLVARWYKCVSCGNCSNWCPRNAIDLRECRPRINARACSSCRICLEVCPISSVYVDKIERHRLGYTFRPKKRAEVQLVLELYRSLTTCGYQRYTKSSAQYGLEGLEFFLKLG